MNIYFIITALVAFGMGMFIFGSIIAIWSIDEIVNRTSKDDMHNITLCLEDSAVSSRQIHTLLTEMKEEIGKLTVNSHTSVMHLENIALHLSKPVIKEVKKRGPYNWKRRQVIRAEEVPVLEEK